MPPLPEQQLTRLAVANQHRMSAYAQRVGDVYGRTFKVIGGADAQAEAAWKHFAVPTMQATQRHVVRTQQAYASLMVRGLGLEPGGDELHPDELVDDEAELTDRYNSPIIEVRSLLSQGRAFLDAVAQAATRATSFARTDVADTTRSSGLVVLQGDGIQFYRRVTSGSACDFCLLIAGQRYNVEELAPAHNNCTCGVAPVTDEADPTFARQASLSKDLYADQQRLDDAQQQVDDAVAA